MGRLDSQNDLYSLRSTAKKKVDRVLHRLLSDYEAGFDMLTYINEELKDASDDLYVVTITERGDKYMSEKERKLYKRQEIKVQNEYIDQLRKIRQKIYDINVKKKPKWLVEVEKKKRFKEYKAKKYDKTM